MASLQKFLGDTVGRLIFKHVTVANVTALGPHFQRLEVRGDFGDPHPGDKVQVALDEGMRTYTPFAVNRSAGTLQLLAFTHSASTPGSRWAQEVRVGDAVRFFGPRRSLNLEALSGEVLLVGDETSFAVARSLNDAGRARVRTVFEVGDAAEGASVLDALGLGGRVLASRGGLAAAVVAEVKARPPRQLVLTGNARSIQAVRAELKRAGLSLPQLTKAYWAEGKRGLD